MINRDRINAAFNAALVSRGKRKGNLKASCPPMGTDAAIMWQALALEVNPYKASIFQLVMLDDEQRQFHKACTEFARNLHSSVKRGVDFDRAKLEAMGAW